MNQIDDTAEPFVLDGHTRIRVRVRVGDPVDPRSLTDVPGDLAGRIVESLGTGGWEVSERLVKGRLVVETDGRCYLTWKNALGAGRTEIPLSWWSRRRVRRAARQVYEALAGREVQA